MTKRRIVLATTVVAVVAVLLVVPLFSPQPASSVQAQVDRHMDDVMKGIEARAMADPASAMSGNPYDYTDDPSFDALVGLGTKALPVIEREIAASPNSGLREYLLAIAGERIAKVDLKAQGRQWETGREWPGRWKAHVRSVPAEVHAIAAAKVPAEQKTERLLKLGTPAIPFVMDEVEAGRTDMAPGLARLMAGTAEVPAPPRSVSRTWVSRNKQRFDLMRSLVEEAR